MDSRPMMFFQKPVLGPTGLSQGRGKEPLHVSFPSGSIGLGIHAPIPESVANDPAGETSVIVASGPEESMMDIRERRIIITTFLLLCIINIVFTCFLYFDANNMDLTLLNVAPSNTGMPAPFGKIPEKRSFLERVNFGFLLFIMIYGGVSVAYENPLGISIYALSISLNFILGLSAMPYFLYAMRLFLDTWMVYLALVLRSKLVLSFLPFYLRDGLHRA